VKPFSKPPIPPIGIPNLLHQRFMLFNVSLLEIHYGFSWGIDDHKSLEIQYKSVVLASKSQRGFFTPKEQEEPPLKNPPNL